MVLEHIQILVCDLMYSAMHLDVEQCYINSTSSIKMAALARPVFAKYGLACVALERDERLLSVSIWQLSRILRHRQFSMRPAM